MRVLMVEPGKAPYEAELDGGLESMRKAVGGDIEGYYPYEDPVVIVCNDEGKINGLPLNRAVYGQDGEMVEIIAGTFFIAGLGEEDFTGLPNYFMEKYKRQFMYPEEFIRLDSGIVAVKQPLPPGEEAREAPAMEGPDGDSVRLDESTGLAFDLDEFFRRNGETYAVLHPDSHGEKERMADELLAGDTGKIRMRIAAIEREGHMKEDAAPLLERVSSYEKEYGLSAYSIYQLDLADSADGLRFMSLNQVQGRGFSVDRDNYEMVYAARRRPGESLEDIYRRFNIDYPEDFRGCSLSVSDVVVLHESGADTAWYVDSIGFKELPDFFGAGTPEAKRGISVREQLDGAKKQAARTAAKAPDKKRAEPERG